MSSRLRLSHCRISPSLALSSFGAFLLPPPKSRPIVRVAVVTVQCRLLQSCEIKLFQNRFSVRRRLSEIILF